ncbi:PREDICTED: TBC1 domain family member 9-like [Acropora digitifera]|uniref:TBC1 domain family member 9-like n=1 Tax=Acropora digitifera TaxID=70779 RepID=UPI00077B00F8|nr:PREDICTED: TBC1 domain family member 9-like [Acropora digitifera]
MRNAQRLKVIQGLEDSMRRNAVRSIAGDTTLFGQKELEQLYAAFKAGHLLTRNHGSQDTPPSFPLVQQQCIDFERFKPLFECLTNWGTGESGETLAQRAFKVSFGDIALWKNFGDTASRAVLDVAYVNILNIQIFLYHESIPQWHPFLQLIVLTLKGKEG